MEYTIAAIPTLYNGRQYRSRLEARWAAFFDLMRWENEYEPFDLGTWSPDFLMRIVIDRYLIEVKPIEGWCEETAEKMLGCVTKKFLTSVDADAPSLLLLGVAPVLDIEARAIHIGWSNDFSEGEYRGWEPCYVGYYKSSAEPAFISILTSRPPERSDVLFGYGEFTMSVWAKATNEVQWQGRRS